MIRPGSPIFDQSSYALSNILDISPVTVFHSKSLKLGVG
jgi:hypothetical protein